MTPLNMEFGIWLCQFFKIDLNLSQNWLKFKKILTKLGNFVQNWDQNWADWYMNGSLFLEKLVSVWVYFQISQWHVSTKTKLEYPPGVPDLVINSICVIIIINLILITCLWCWFVKRGCMTMVGVVGVCVFLNFFSHSLQLKKGRNKW